MENHFRYCVLYTRVLKQAELTEVLQDSLPEARGTVFYPCMESWRRGKGELELKALFPGYVFIRSDMDIRELHETVRKQRAKLGSFVRELGLSEKRASGVDVFEGDEDDCKITDLSVEEESFMDFLLDIGSDGLIRMSYGYKEDDRLVVMEGPLKSNEDRIVDVNIHDRKAFLDFEFNGYIARAGLEIKPKRHWFPNDKDAPDVLNDGTEVDTRKLSKKMMGG